MKIINEAYKVMALAQRDLLKFLRDKPRIIATFIFPVIFLGVFGVTLNAGIGKMSLGYSYINYVFSGIILQTLFQSSFSGIVSLIVDREEDFAMSIFVSPVSRFSIVLGKIIGEGLVSVTQLVGIVIFGYMVGVTLPISNIIFSLPFLLVATFVGGSFGIFISSRINSAENARRIFPFLTFPMIFLSGAFTPVNNLPLVLNVLKVINPLFYGVDLFRSFLFRGLAEKSFVVVNNPIFDIVIFLGLGVLFFVFGTYFFANKEGNK